MIAPLVSGQDTTPSNTRVLVAPTSELPGVFGKHADSGFQDPTLVLLSENHCSRAMKLTFQTTPESLASKGL